MLQLGWKFSFNTFRCNHYFGWRLGELFEPQIPERNCFRREKSSSPSSSLSSAVSLPLLSLFLSFSPSSFFSSRLPSSSFSGDGNFPLHVSFSMRSLSHNGNISVARRVFLSFLLSSPFAPFPSSFSVSLPNSFSLLPLLSLSMRRRIRRRGVCLFSPSLLSLSLYLSLSSLPLSRDENFPSRGEAGGVSFSSLWFSLWPLLPPSRERNERRENRAEKR